MMAVPGDSEQEEREINGNFINNNENDDAMAAKSRKEKRKALKKMKRKQARREMAVKEREMEEARLNDPKEQMTLQRLQQEEAERMERERIEFEEREREFLQALEMKKKQEQEEEDNRKLLDESQRNLVENENAKESIEGDDWEYEEEGPAEIIWKGNEIIVKKKKVRVPKKGPDQLIKKQESDRPISNPLAPQSEAFEDYKSAQQVLESVAQEVPNFGTEQDKAHCPFHLKTGVCRFGAHCSRVHFYPDKSCTLLMKNMYSGPGLTWEQDEGLECTDEEVERSFEEFYEDVHTEFLKFGEIVNFKVCKNGSSHLRGNVYVHYKSLESAVIAYQSINGRYFAGKQISCEFVNLMRWKVAICGEYMKSRLKTCSRGSACNFIHCFRNPGGDYEWADWDKPAPRYWLKKISALFGYASDRLTDDGSPSYRSRRSRSRGPDSTYGNSRFDEDGDWKRDHHRSRRGDDREGISNLNEKMYEEKISSKEYHRVKHRESETFDISDESSDDKKSYGRRKRSSGKREKNPELPRQDSEGRKHASDPDKNRSSKKGVSDRYLENSSRSSSRHNHNDKVDSYERHHDVNHRHIREHSFSSDIDSRGDRLDRDEDRRHRHSRKSSRQVKNEAELSDSASDGYRHGRDEKRPQKRRKKHSKSKYESDYTDTESDRHHGHGRKSSRHHRKESKMSKIDSSPHKYRDSCFEGLESEMDDKNYDLDHKSHVDKGKEEKSASQKVEDECEQAYRLAALKKLEEIRKYKATQTVHSREHMESTEIYSCGNIGVEKVAEVNKDMEKSPALLTRRRI